MYGICLMSPSEGRCKCGSIFTLDLNFWIFPQVVKAGLLEDLIGAKSFTVYHADLVPDRARTAMGSKGGAALKENRVRRSKVHCAQVCRIKEGLLCHATESSSLMQGGRLHELTLIPEKPLVLRCTRQWRGTTLGRESRR